SRPILPDQGVHLTGADAQQDAIKSSRGSKPLRNSGHFQKQARVVVHFSAALPACLPPRGPSTCPPYCSPWDRQCPPLVLGIALPGSAPSAGPSPRSGRRIPIPTGT